MRSMPVLFALACVAACQAPTAPPDPYTPPPARCPSNPAVLLSDPTCVVAPEPTVIGILIASNTSAGMVLTPDSLAIVQAPYLGQFEADRRWVLAPAIHVRLSNGDSRAANSYRFTPDEPAVLEVRYGPDAFRAWAAQCTTMVIEAEGVARRVKVDARSSYNGPCR